MAAARYLDGLRSELATHDKALCSWQSDGVCQASQERGSIACEFHGNPLDHTEYTVLFSRLGQGAIGEWLLRIRDGEPDLGVIWHVLTDELNNLASLQKKWPKARWDPSFDHAARLQLFHEPDRAVSILSDWEAGRVPFAQFIVSGS